MRGRTSFIGRRRGRRRSVIGSGAVAASGIAAKVALTFTGDASRVRAPTHANVSHHGVVVAVARLDEAGFSAQIRALGRDMTETGVANLAIVACVHGRNDG